ncbi:hypothetical protein [Streptomyces paromomycinus]|uniref:Uncharacterized protein n=1 Tax=Streptomyces paromomycinus TaxID=92743 RepID=A0A401VZ24_STREY|nr:hypothetical protein [Streptomyces paromomycinus]GCD42330.1 hypothetical protein GKJPGBOP_01989 [Streptomyces paromomycinus]
MVAVTGRARGRLTAAVLVAVPQSVARLVGRLRQGQFETARRDTQDALDALRGLALLLDDHRGPAEDAGLRLVELLAQCGYPVPAVEMLGQGS